MSTNRQLYIGNIPDLGDLDSLESAMQEALRSRKESNELDPEEAEIFYDEFRKFADFLKQTRQIGEKIYEDSLKLFESDNIRFIGSCGQTNSLTKESLPFALYDVALRQKQYPFLIGLHLENESPDIIPSSELPDVVLHAVANAYQQYYSKFNSERTTSEEKRNLAAFVVAHDKRLFNPNNLKDRSLSEQVGIIEESIGGVYTFDFQ